jgi:hypothetical protein
MELTRIFFWFSIVDVNGLGSVLLYNEIFMIELKMKRKRKYVK